TLLQGDSAIRDLDTAKRTAIVNIGTSEQTTFQQELQKHFTDHAIFNVAKNASVANLNKILKELDKFDQVIVGVFDTRKRPGSKIDYNSNVKFMISELAGGKSIINIFANPYIIAGLPGIEKSNALIMGYQMSDEMERSA